MAHIIDPAPHPVRQRALAQAAIMGVAGDGGGRVMPRSIVEATSPALIERVRTVTTDGEGVQIVALRKGTHDVTFTLTGFSTARPGGLPGRHSRRHHLRSDREAWE